MVAVANAVETVTTNAGGFASFIPLLILGIVLAFIAAKFAKRKRKKPVLYVLLALIPAFGGLVLIWLASLTDKEVLDRLSQLEDKPE